MSINNTNSAPEAQEIKKNQKNPAVLFGLVKKSINSYVRSSNNQGSILAYIEGDSSQFKAIQSALLKNILTYRNTFPKTSDEANLTEADISEYLKDISRIRRMILDETIDRRSLENTMWTTLKNRYSKNALDTHTDSIKSRIRELDEVDIKKCLHSRDFGHKKIVAGVIQPAPIWRNLSELTEDLDIPQETLDTNPRIKYTLQHYLETGVMGISDIEELFEAQSNMPLVNKREILAFFVPTISIHMLERMGISQINKEKKAEEIINTYLTEQGILQPNQTIYDNIHDIDLKDEIKIWMNHIEGLYMPTTNLDDTSINKLFDKESGILTEAIADHMKAIGQQEQVRSIPSLSQFKNRIKKELVNQNGNCLIENIDALTTHSYIISDSGSTEEKAWKVLECDVMIAGSDASAPRGFTLEGFHSNGSPLGMASHTEYDVLFHAFREKVKNGSISISADIPTYIQAHESEAPFSNFDEFSNWIDSIDTKNKTKKIENGMSFSVKIDNQIEIYRIEKIDKNSNTFSVRDIYNKLYHPSLTTQGFYDRLREGGSDHFGFQRLGDFSTLEKFASNTSISNIVYENNGLYLHENNAHDDGHVHSEKHENKPVWGFEDDEGHVIETQFEGNLVTIFEYQPYQESKKKTETEKDGSIKEKRKVDKKMKRIEYPKMTIEGLQAFLQKEKFTKAVAENPHTKKSEEIHDGVHPHFHNRSLLSKFMGMKNFADIGKAFSMGTHMLTHMLEEQSKMHAAEAMYGFFSKTLGKDHALTMHALMEFSGDIGKAIDEKVSHLKRLAGLPRRKEIKHILLTRPAKPHDILAALIVTADMAGHLYPDSELQDLQGGQYVWFDSVCIALGYDPKTELKTAQEKEASKNAETSDHMHETTLLTRFFKAHQDDNPYIQAIAGGSKFWNAVSSGRSAQSEKGKKEGGEFLGAMDRAEYVVSKLESNEPEIAMGAYPTVFGKDPSAVNLGPAFVWALSNFPNTSHPETSNTFKNMMDGNGVAFHALPFCRNKRNSNTYKATMDTLIHNLAHKDPSKYGSMKSAWEKTKMYKVPAGEYTFQENHIKELWLFWKDYNKILHPFLQLTDPYICTLIEDSHTSPADRSTLSNYIDILGTTVKEGRLNDVGPDDNIMKMGGYRFGGGSMIVDIDPNDKQKSINRLLDYIHIGQNGDIQNKHQREQIWDGQIIPYLQSIRENQNFIDNPELQEQQFIKIHDEIMHFLRQRIVDRYFSGAEKQDYIRQLSGLGFDMSKSNIHQQELPGKPVDFKGKEAFQRFKNNTPTGSKAVQDQVHTFSTELLGRSANDSSYRQAA